MIWVIFVYKYFRDEFLRPDGVGRLLRILDDRSWQRILTNRFGRVSFTYASWLGLYVEDHLQVVREINVSVGLGRGRGTGQDRFHRLGFGPGRRRRRRCSRGRPLVATGILDGGCWLADGCLRSDWS